MNPDIRRMLFHNLRATEWNPVWDFIQEQGLEPLVRALLPVLQEREDSRHDAFRNAKDGDRSRLYRRWRRAAFLRGQLEEGIEYYFGAK